MKPLLLILFAAYAPCPALAKVDCAPFVIAGVTSYRVQVIEVPPGRYTVEQSCDLRHWRSTVVLTKTGEIGVGFAATQREGFVRIKL